LSGQRDINYISRLKAQQLTIAPFLALPVKGKNFIIYSNASKNALRCVLMLGKKKQSGGSCLSTNQAL